MSAQEQDNEFYGIGLLEPGPLASISTIGGYDATGDLEDADGLDEATTAINRLKAQASEGATDEQAELVRATFTLIQGAMDDGELPYAQVPKFFGWLRYGLGVPSLTLATVTGGALAGYLLKYAQEHGYHPAKGPTYDLDKPLPKVTEGHKAVAAATIGVGKSQVTAPGLTPVEAKAISVALGIVYDDVNKVTAATVDAMLPGMVPGQVPEALRQLDTAAGVLEAQVNALRRQIGGHNVGGVVGTLSGVGAAVTALQGEVKALSEQMEGDKTSGLLADADTLREAIALNTVDIHTINKTLPDLATTAALTALTGHVAVVSEDLALKHASALDTALNGVEHKVLALQQKDDDLDECCEANAEITNPIRAGGATPSLLKSLGGLLKTAVEGIFLGSLLDSVLLIFDAPAVISTTVIDTETLSNWAISSAGVIEQDLSWLGKFPSGG